MWNHLLEVPCSNARRTYWLLYTGFDDILWLGWRYCKHWCFCSFVFYADSPHLIQWAYGWCCVWTYEAMEDLGFEVKLFWCWDLSETLMKTVIFTDSFPLHWTVWILNCCLQCLNQFVIRMITVYVWKHIILFPKT